jgi:hypothetical protein
MLENVPKATSERAPLGNVVLSESITREKQLADSHLKSSPSAKSNRPSLMPAALPGKEQSESSDEIEYDSSNMDKFE